MPYIIGFFVMKIGVPKGIRAPVAAVKGQCPRPLDDGDVYNLRLLHHYIRCVKSVVLAQSV